MKVVKFIPSKLQFNNFLKKRLECFDIDYGVIINHMEETICNCRNRFSLIKNKYFQDENNIYFRTGHYCQFFIIIYELMRVIFSKNKGDNLLEKLFYLNTTQSNLDIYYTTELPKKFFLVHPFGSVVGPRTVFGERSSLIIYNNCSLGRNNQDDHPNIEGDLIMLPNSTIAGNCRIKGKVMLSNGCYLYNPGEIKNKIVFGRYPHNIYKDINIYSFNSWNEFIN